MHLYHHQQIPSSSQRQPGLLAVTEKKDGTKTEEQFDGIGRESRVYRKIKSDFNIGLGGSGRLDKQNLGGAAGEIISFTMKGKGSKLLSSALKGIAKAYNLLFWQFPLLFSELT
jgi:hypothetical protein